MKKGFTLAEVLITLGIIGVVAALTIPVLIQKHNNMIVETRLKKVYSLMNQAILRAEADYGAKEFWDYGSTDFWDKYFKPYIKVLKTEISRIGNVSYMKVYFPDGSLMLFKYSTFTTDENEQETETIINSYDYFFYPNAKNFDEITFENREGIGATMFAFRYAPLSTNSFDKFHKKKGFLPYARKLEDDFSNLYSGDGNSCNSLKRGLFCTFAIMQNGWKIPDNYPFKVK